MEDTSTVDTQIDTQMGSESSNTEYSADQIFDMAKEHYFGVRPDVQSNAVNTDGSENQEVQEDMQNREAQDQQVEDPGAEVDQTEVQETDSQPWRFKGKVFGKEMEADYTPDQVNDYISKGHAAETIYKRYKSLQNEMEELRSKADVSDNFEHMASNEPEALLEMIFEKHLGEEATANFILKKFEALREFAKLSPEERAHQKKLQAADRILKQQQELEQTQKMAEAEEAKRAEERAYQEKKSWANSELQLAKARFANLDEKVIKNQILAVMAIADRQKDAGRPMTLAQQTKLLNDYLAPFKSLGKQTNLKNEIGKLADKTKAQAQQSVRSAARSVNPQHRAAEQSSKPRSQDEIWDMIKQGVAEGRYTFKP